MNNKKIVYGAIAITFIVAVLALFVGVHSQGSKSAGYGAVATSTTNLPSLSLNTIQLGTGCDQGFGSPTCLTTTVSSGSCTAATTTLFAVLNPFGATTTVNYAEIFGTQGATTTDIVIATSSTAFSGVDSAIYNAFASSSASINFKGGNFLSAMSVATSAPFFLATTGYTKGNLFQGTSTDYYGTSTANTTSITVGGSEYIIGYSTSTTAGVGNGGTTSGTQPIPSVCRYTIEWKR